MAQKDTEGRKVFSIILATYNCGRKVESTIESILSQNRNLFELIVIDGASSDDTLEHIKKYAGDLTLRSEKDAGIYHAFNKGIDGAAGEYLYFIGAGDRLRSGVLEIAAAALSSPADAPSFLYGDAFVVDKQIFYGGEFDNVRLGIDNICHQSIFYRRRVFDWVGRYETRYRISADWALNMKCFGDARVGRRHIDCVIVDFEGGGLSSFAEDAAFNRDFPGLIRNRLGIKSYVTYKKPLLHSRFYWKFYYPFVRPFIKTLRRLRNSGDKQ